MKNPAQRKWSISILFYVFSVVVFAAMLAVPVEVEGQSTSVWTGGGGDSDWANSSNWTNGIPNNQTVNFNAVIDDNNLIDSSVNSLGDFIINNLRVDSGDSLFVQNNSLTIADTTLENSGMIEIQSVANVLLGDGVTITGTGTITLSDNGILASSDASGTGVDSFTIGAGQIVQGEGEVGFDVSSIINNGTIQAGNTGIGGVSLVLDVGVDEFINNGTLRASFDPNGGSSLVFQDGIYTNSGTIDVQDDSRIIFQDGVVVRGGTFQGAGSGNFEIDSDNVVTLGGTISNNARIEIGDATAGDGTLTIEDGTILNGTGSLALFTGSTVTGDTANASLQIGASQTVIGFGLFGNNSLTVVNDGTVDANNSAAVLAVNPGTGGFTNNGLLTASGGGTLELQGNFDNNNGVIRAQENSRIQLNGSDITGGTIENVTSGRVFVAGGSATLRGSINQTARMQVDAGGTVVLGNNTFFTGMILGDIDLNTPTSILTTENLSDFVINGGAHAIRGQGIIGNNSGNFRNQGIIVASGGGTMTLNPGNFENIAFVFSETGNTLQIENSYTQTRGATVLFGGTINSSVALELTGGSLEGNGTVNAIVNLGGTLSAGRGIADIGILDIDEINLGSAAESLFELGGRSQGDEFDFIRVGDDLVLDGELRVSLINGFESTIASTDQFEIFNSGALSSTFTNVANGEFLMTENQLGQFQVFYGTGSPFNSNSVFLANFQTAVPEPSAGFVLAGMAFFAASRRRRR